MKNLTANLQELTNKIEILKDKVLKDNTPLRVSTEAANRVKEIMNIICDGKEIENSKELSQEMDSLMPLVNKAQNIETIRSFENTLKLDLMVVNTRYVMLEKGKKIQSPAGFHPDTMVYTKPSGTVILTDRLPKASNLGYYDLQK